MILKQILINLFVCGILCSAALIFSGSGPLREPVRICCVCLMTVAVFTFVSKGFSHIDTSFKLNDFESEISGGIENSEKDLDETAGVILSENIESRMKEDEIFCSVKTVFAEREVININVFCREDDFESIKRILIDEYGFKEDLIVWRKNENKNTGIHKNVVG